MSVQNSRSILNKAVSAYQLIRDASIDLKGLPCVWYSGNTDPGKDNRRDFYGDIRKDLQMSAQYIYMLLSISPSELEELSTYANNVTDNYPAEIIGRVKTTTDIREGDIVEFDLIKLGALKGDVKQLYVSRVTSKYSPKLVARYVSLVPVKNANILP